MLQPRQEEQLVIYNVGREEYQACTVTSPQPRQQNTLDDNNILQYILIIIQGKWTWLEDLSNSFADKNFMYFLVLFETWKTCARNCSIFLDSVLAKPIFRFNQKRKVSRHFLITVLSLELFDSCWLRSVLLSRIVAYCTQPYQRK